MPDLAALTARPTLTDAVVDAVRDAIRGRTLVPGEIYSVAQVADRLGVSRSPAREALLKLAEAGLVEFSRNRGFQVVLPDPRAVAEIFGVRLALEPAAARRVAASGRGADEITETLAAMKRAVRGRDEPSYWAGDHRLHHLLLTHAGNARAAAVVASLRSTTSLLGPPTSAKARSLNAVCRDHAPVVAAVVARDPDAAEAAMREHLESTGRLLVAQTAGLRTDHPDLVALWADVV